MFDLTLAQYLLNFWLVPVVVLLSPLGVRPFAQINLIDCFKITTPSALFLAAIAHGSALMG